MDIEKFKITLDVARHRLLPNGVHTNNGGNWNMVWKEFFKVNPAATKDQIIKQLIDMRNIFGI